MTPNKECIWGWTAAWLTRFIGGVNTVLSVILLVRSVQAILPCYDDGKAHYPPWYTIDLTYNILGICFLLFNISMSVALIIGSFTGNPKILSIWICYTLAKLVTAFFFVLINFQCPHLGSIQTKLILIIFQFVFLHFVMAHKKHLDDAQDVTIVSLQSTASIIRV